MKTCTVCGYKENTDISEVCPKCKSTLNVPSKVEKKTVIGAGYPANRLATKNTLISNANAIDYTTSQLNCSNCNYPLRVGEAVCPSCGNEHLNSSTISDNFNSPILIPKLMHPNPKSKTTKRLEDFSLEAEIPVIKLKPLNNKRLTELESSQGILEASRETIDSNDESLSSKNHIVIQFKDGKWFISNQATNKAVFVQVNKEVELNNDDLILLGEKKYYKVIIE